MPDLRTLLDEASARPPAADPVGVVHRRVRRQAARRRASGAAATMAATAGVVVVTRPDPAGPVRPATTVGDHRFQTGWRSFPLLDGRGGAMVEDKAWHRLARLVSRNEEAFVGFVQVRPPDGPLRYRVALSADADQAAWAGEIAEAAGDRPVTVEQCPRTAA
jgi:hypothetical protein